MTGQTMGISSNVVHACGQWSLSIVVMSAMCVESKKQFKDVDVISNQGICKILVVAYNVHHSLVHLHSEIG